MEEIEQRIQSFITKDGTDANGIRAEVKVTTGIAEVTKIDTPKNRDSTMRKVMFSTPDSQWPTGAWLDMKKDKELYDMFEKAYDDRTPVGFRIEVQRKSSVDRSLPMSEIAPRDNQEKAFENTFRNVVAGKWADDEKWTVGSAMVTLFKEDPLGGAVQASEADIAAKVGTPPVNQKTPGSAPYSVRLYDGSVNPNSYALMSPVQMLTFLKEHIFTRPDFAGMTDRDEQTFALKMLAVVSRVQKECFHDSEGPVDMGEYSFRVSEEIVRDVLKVMVKPRESFSEAADFREWLDDYSVRIAEVAIKMGDWSMRAVDKLHGREI